MAAPSTAGESEKILALLNGPAGAPPAGVKSNFDNPPNLHTNLIATVVVGLVSSTLVVVIRFYSKLVLIKSTAYEDYAVLMAWVGHVGLTVPSAFASKVGGGRHMWDIRLKDFFQLLYCLHCIILCLVKISILLQYLRIFIPNRKGNMPLYVTIHVLAWSNIGFYLVATIFEIIMCSPREKIWNPLISTGHCYNANAAYMATGIFNVISDFSILILPMIPISKLQMPLKKKIMMIAIFAAGAIACAISTVRTFYAFKIVQTPDVSYSIMIMGLWTGAELTSGIIVSCLPVTPRFFQFLRPKVSCVFSNLFSSSSGSQSRLTTGSKTESRRDQNQSNKVERGLGETEGKTVYNSRTHRKGEYMTLSELDTAPVVNDATSGRLPASNDGGLMRGDDLERGRCAP